MADRDPSDDEEESERNSRRLLELLQEIRVATAGVQILFGFLLAVPFAQRFETISSFQRHVFLTVLICTALSSALSLSTGPSCLLTVRPTVAPSALVIGLFRQRPVTLEVRRENSTNGGLVHQGNLAPTEA